MSVYFEKARELGKLMLESDEMKKVIVARETFYSNPEALKKTEDFNTYQTNFQTDVKAGKLDGEKIGEGNAKLAELFESLEKDEIVGALISAEKDFNDFTNNVFNVLRATLSGEELNNGCEGCSSSCECGGSCK